ncbi:MAG: rhodanese-like domain-containing protein [Candidatus Dasytiphilus stammeri]
MQEIMRLFTIHPTLCIIWITLLLFLVISTIKVLFSKYKFISCREAILLINRQDAKVLDIRSQNEYYNAHIPNSINILASDIKNGYYEQLLTYKNYPIIIIGSGINQIEETEIASKLNHAEFQKVYILELGLIGWNNEYLPLVKG